MSTRSWTSTLAVSAVIAVAGSTFVYAQQSGSPGPSDRSNQIRPERFRPTADDFSAFTDARVAAIKAGLRLNAEQEKNWPAFEEAFRNLAKLHTDRILAFRDGSPSPPADMLEGLQRRADVLGRSAAALRQVADATTPLYKSLDDAQKRRFAVLAPMLRQQPDQPNFRRDGQNPERLSPRGMDRPRGGAMERIRFDSHEVGHDDSGDPGIGVARENGWR
jgi:zinc resistance-associated protein